MDSSGGIYRHVLLIDEPAVLRDGPDLGAGRVLADEAGAGGGDG